MDRNAFNENSMLQGWGNDSLVKSTLCSGRGVSFDPQHPHGI